MINKITPSQLIELMACVEIYAQQRGLSVVSVHLRNDGISIECETDEVLEHDGGDDEIVTDFHHATLDDVYSVM